MDSALGAGIVDGARSKEQLMTVKQEPIRMEIKGLMLDPSSNVPIVILRDAERRLFLPIWIGVFEANAIALGLEGVSRRDR